MTTKTKRPRSGQTKGATLTNQDNQTLPPTGGAAQAKIDLAQFISRGWAFTPLTKDGPAAGKRPIRSAWQKEDPLSLEDLNRYIDSGHNIGLRTGQASGGIVVVDIDGHTDLIFPETLTVKTGKGKHLYYRHTGKLSGRVRLRENIDIRAEGNQVVFPGSTHALTGRVYEFENPGAEIVELPEWVAEACQKKPKPKPTTKPPTTPAPISGRLKRGYLQQATLAESMTVRHATDGERNHTLNKSSYKLGGLAHAGLSREQAEQALIDAAIHAGLDEAEAQKTFSSGWSDGVANPRDIEPRNATRDEGDGDGEHPETFMRTGCGNARRLRHYFGDDLRFVSTWGEWIVWDGRRWGKDPAGVSVQRLGKKTVGRIFAEAQLLSDDDDPLDKGLKGPSSRTLHNGWAVQCQTSSRIDDMVRLTRSEPGIPILHTDLDADRYLFNCKSGTLDLETGTLREHRRGDLITKVGGTGYDTGTPTRWLEYLETVCCGDRELIDYLQRVCGYFLSGDVSERAFFFLIGDGDNGKSVFANVLSSVLGDYMCVPHPELLVSGGNPLPPTETRILEGRRLAVCSEIEQNRTWSCGTLKRLTSLEAIQARKSHKDAEEAFQPTHKFLITANHKPTLPKGGDDDGAFWRRMHLVPFRAKIKKKTPNLERKLIQAEGANILGWMAEGFALWKKKQGLAAPAIVRRETGSYRKAADIIGEALRELCIFDQESCVPFKDLYEAITDHTRDASLSTTHLSNWLKSRGHEKTRQWMEVDGETANPTLYHGLRLRDRG